MPFHLPRRRLLATGAALAAAPSLARAAGNPVRIGVLTDESGPYADSGGAGSILAARMAVHDTGGSVLGRPVEVIHGDTQNKPDVAASLARQWYDSGVDAITDLPVTPVAAAVQQIAREKHRTVMITAAAVTAFTAKTCSPVSTHWADDTHALTTGTTREVLRAGGRSWFFITVDFAFGTSIEQLASDIIRTGGGSVLGAARYPLGTTDFAALVLRAQSSKAQVIGLASVGTDQVNLIKQAAEFGLQVSGKQRLVGFLVYITDIHALGLAAAQGLSFTSAFYWNQDDGSRAFSKRFYAERHAMPTRNQASVYLATRHWLRAIAQAGTVDALPVNKAMRAMPVDYFGRKASIRADGRVLYDLELWRVKRPAESHGPWDYYAPVATIPAAEAFAPMVPACAS